MAKTYVDERGYKRFKSSGKLVHRYVAYKHIYKKRALFQYPGGFGRYEIHHKNGNKLDNRVDNLQIVTHSEHQRIHNIHTNTEVKSTYNESASDSAAGIFFLIIGILCMWSFVTMLFGIFFIIGGIILLNNKEPKKF